LKGFKNKQNKLILILLLKDKKTVYFVKGS